MEKEKADRDREENRKGREQVPKAGPEQIHRMIKSLSGLLEQSPAVLRIVLNNRRDLPLCRPASIQVDSVQAVREFGGTTRILRMEPGILRYSSILENDTEVFAVLPGPEAQKRTGRQGHAGPFDMNTNEVM